jgi:hypothetical protein
MWWVGNIIRRLIVLGVLTVVGLALFTQYAFQEPFMVTWSRYAKPQIEWQKGKYPSASPAFDIIGSLLTDTDPRDDFRPIGPARPPARPSNWRPTAVGPRLSGSRPVTATGTGTVVTSATELLREIGTAGPGTVITIAPGAYEIKRHSIELSANGTKGRPIRLRADALGTVTLRLISLEGLHVTGAYWIIENLLIEGACGNDGSCDHAFHVVGGARGTVIRNNWVSNFNSTIKVNGANGKYPDDGEILNNAFVNDAPRKTDSPVTVLDIVAVNGWRVAGNFIADFAKGLGNRVSYGAFFKGGGDGNVFERNLVRCEWRHRGGARIGFSFGGGGTTSQACRGGKCAFESIRGTMRSNIVMDCPNDVGVYVNKSPESVIHNNFILKTRGVDVRFAGSTADIFNNVIDGRILARADGT